MLHRSVNMIKTLSIKDFIIIDELKLDFDKGFNVITGETGAGKSIIINAIDLAFGARANKELIKTDKTRAVIELTLIIDNFKRNNRIRLTLKNKRSTCHSRRY